MEVGQEIPTTSLEGKTMAISGLHEDKYRSIFLQEAKRDINWRFGAPPNYDAVNKLFEEGRTKIWPSGSLEETVQNMVKNWEMEVLHKTSFDDYVTLDPKKYTISLNGRKAINLEEKSKLGGGYNSLLQTSLPQKMRIYDPLVETAESSHRAFTTAFPRGFALEIVEVYSGPPSIVYKFRHWAFMEGPFKGHPPTGEKVEFFGISIFQLDDKDKIVKVEFFYDPAELLGALVKGSDFNGGSDEKASPSCPFLKHTA